MDLIPLLINVIIVGVIIWLLLWAIGAVGIPEPFNKIARVIIIVIAVIYLLKILVPFIQ